MAYFPNGTAGEIYLESYCLRCKNWKQRKTEDTPGCPIWDMHMLLNYDRDKCGQALDALIPMDKEMNPQQCRMFEWNGECRGQIKMF